MSTLAALTANCWMAAATTFNVPVGLLSAIAEVESAFDPHAVGRNTDGSYDIGLMQINSQWLPVLQKAGITERALYKPCVNIHVGAWILSQEVARYGYNWEAIGAYNAGPYSGRSMHRKLSIYREYSRKVLTAWRRLERRSASVAMLVRAGE